VNEEEDEYRISEENNSVNLPPENNFSFNSKKLIN
jgi:hypothetical protein